MLDCQRHLFDMPDDVVWLNNASQGPLLKAAVAAGHVGVERKAHPWFVYRSRVEEEADKCRDLFAGLVGATGSDIAVVPATSYGVAVAAANIEIPAGRRIVALESQFPNNLYAWRIRAHQTGAQMVEVARPEDGDWTAAVLAEIDERTALATLPPSHWTDGAAIDLERISDRCREVGAALFVDATQAAGAMPIDVGRLQPDYLVASGYKWLLCPYRLSFLYVAPHRQDGRPVEHAKWNCGAVPPDGAHHRGNDAPNGGTRFDMGERHDPIALTMGIAALRQLNDWEPAEISATIAPLTDAIAEGAAEHGLSFPARPHRVPHYIGLRRPAAPFTEDVGRKLAAQNVHVSMRGDSLRLSPHVYCRPADVERFFSALDAAAGG